MAHNQRAWCLLVVTLLLTLPLAYLVFQRQLGKLAINQANYGSISDWATRESVHALLGLPWGNDVSQEGTAETWKGWETQITVFYGPNEKVVYKTAKNRSFKGAGWLALLGCGELVLVSLGCIFLPIYNKRWCPILGWPLLIYATAFVIWAFKFGQRVVPPEPTFFEEYAPLLVGQAFALTAGVVAGCAGLVFGSRSLFTGVLPLTKARKLTGLKAQLISCLVIAGAVQFLIFVGLYSFDGRIY
jgi:hypothetical protein